jgi:ferredoxin-thioredoxin reductase catalytic subunit
MAMSFQCHSSAALLLVQEPLYALIRGVEGLLVRSVQFGGEEISCPYRLSKNDSSEIRPAAIACSLTDCTTSTPLKQLTSCTFCERI